jgi:hypothetical protein
MSGLEAAFAFVLQEFKRSRDALVIEIKVTPGLLVSCEEGPAKKLSAYTKTAGVLSPAVPVTKGKS